VTDPVLAMLLRDISAHPDDDGPRLAYADRLEETGADDARAEFIRVQCQLEPLRGHGHGAGNPHGGDCPTCLRAARLGRRERDLLHDGGRWLPEAFAGRVGGLGIPSHRFLRGFVGEVELPCDAWQKHGPALVRAAPVTRVRLTDRTPNPVDGERRRYYWWHRDLPADVYRLMACDDAQPVAPRERPNWKRYPGLAAAEIAASDALLAWARAVATTAPAPVN
jgi:uncharacterized protein (TIGR02996 family)